MPDGFVFHVKLFGVFCGVGVLLNALPRTAMPCIQPVIVARGNAARVGVDDLPGAAVDALSWSRFHEALQPLRDAGKLGAIVVQFQNPFWPSSANRRIVEGVRRRLDGALQIALELRCRGWSVEAELPGTLAWMRSQRPHLARRRRRPQARRRRSPTARRRALRPARRSSGCSSLCT